jgi:type IV pilus assembly protein PilM
LAFDNAEASGVHVLLDVGAAATQIVIGRGSELCVVKSVSTGVRQIEEVVSRRLSVSTEDVRQLRSRLSESAASPIASASRPDPVRQALYDAIRLATAGLFEQALLCLRYYTVSFRGRPSAKVWMTGGGAEGAELRELASSALGLSVEPLPLMAGMPLGPLMSLDNTAPLGEWAVAYGLALRGVPQAQAAFGATCAEVPHA